MYAWVVMLPPQAGGGGGPTVPAMIMQAPHGQQAVPLVSFNAKQAEMMRDWAQTVANRVNATIHLIRLGAPEFVEGLEPKAISVAQTMPAHVVMPTKT